MKHQMKNLWVSGCKMVYLSFDNAKSSDNGNGCGSISVNRASGGDRGTEMSQMQRSIRNTKLSNENVMNVN